MKWLSGFSLLIVIMFLAACSSPVTKNPDSYLYSVPVGSSLRLNKTITIPANLARRFFQDGKVVNESDINIYYPHCSLLMNNLVEYERSLPPTEFTIIRVLDDEEYARRYVLYASNVVSGDSLGDGPSIVGYVTYYYLQSSSAPNVRSLECIQWDDPVNVEYLSINEIKQALGKYFTLGISGS